MSCSQDSQDFLDRARVTCREDFLDKEAAQDGVALGKAPSQGELSLWWWYQLFKKLVPLF